MPIKKRHHFQKNLDWNSALNWNRLKKILLFSVTTTVAEFQENRKMHIGAEITSFLATMHKIKLFSTLLAYYYE